MRRRRSSRAYSAEQLVALRREAHRAVGDLPPAERSIELRARLRAAGTDSLTCIQAQYWIRRGKPAYYLPAIQHGWTS